MTVRLRGDVITWGKSDVRTMASFIGPDAAVTRKCPYLPSVLRLARKKLVLDRHARRALAHEQALRDEAERWKHKLDAVPTHKRERKAFGHQRSFIKFARRMRKRGVRSFLVADEVGVGKTGSAILYLHSIGARNILVVTKNTAKDQWHDAYRFFLRKECPALTVVEGTIAEQIQQAKREGVVIAHWESLALAQKGYLSRKWDAVIADEAHMAGNHETKRSNTLHRLKAVDRVPTTASPFTNHPGELFGILQFMYPQRYTSYWRFAHMHCAMTPKLFGGVEMDGARRPSLLAWELAPYMVQRTKKQVFPNLPLMANTRRTLRLSKRGEREYAKLRKELFAELKALGGGSKVIPIINDLARLTRVRQYLVDPGLIGARERSVKHEAILEDMQSFTNPFVIFSEWKQAVLRLGAFLTKNKFRVGYIYGGMTKNGKATRAKKRFLAGDYDALLIVAGAGDTALNLGKYGLVGHLDLPWHPRGWEQRNGRVDRPEENTGKLVPTTAYRYLIRNSYEERLEKRIARKHATVRDVFTVADLEELFQ